MIIFDIVMAPIKISKSKSQEFKGLSIKKNREKNSLFIAEGEKCVTDMMPCFRLNFLICNERWWQEKGENIGIKEDQVLLADQRTLSSISNLVSPPEVIAIFQIPEKKKDLPKLSKDKFYILLDEIQDPGNLGTIIRTCDWFGVYDIFASETTVDVYNPKVVQATMGSLTRVKINYLDLKTLIEANREIPLYGTLLNGQNLYDIKNAKPGLILMGNEGKGISEGLKNLIDIPITIPPFNKTSHPDSLNVAVATSIILSQIRNPL